MSEPLSVNGISLGFYPDEGDAGGTKSYLSDLNTALTSSWPSHSPCPAPTINVVGWYAQTYPHEEFTGFQLLALVDDIKSEYSRCNSGVKFIYEASIMPFQSWVGYTPDNDVKAVEVARVMQTMIDRSKTPSGDYAISEIRLRFGHEMNYYQKSGLYPPPTNPSDPGANYRLAFDTVAHTIRSLPSPYKEMIKMFWCPNIASTSSGAPAEYEMFLHSLSLIDYVGIDYYCPSPGNLNEGDFVRKMKKVHDKYACAERPFILGETGLHFDEREGGGMDAKLRWLDVITGREARKGLKWMSGVGWFNYEKDRDYRLVWVGERERGENRAFVSWVVGEMERVKKKEGDVAMEVSGGGKAKKFWKALLAN